MQSEWPRVPLGDVLLLLSNGLTAEQNRDGIGAPVTRIETIADDRIDAERVGYVVDLSDAVTAKFRLAPGDLLFSHINSEPQIGRTVVYQGEPPMLLHGMNLLRIRVNEQVLIPDFLSYLFRQYRESGIFVSIASRAVGQSSINQGRLRSLEILLPPIDEQKAIVDSLKVIEAASSKYSRELALESERKRALAEHLIRSGTSCEECKQTALGNVPRSWSVEPLEDVVKVATGQVDPRVEPYASMVHVGPENIESETGKLHATKTAKELELISGKYLFTLDDVLYSKIRPYLRKAALPTFTGVCSADMYPLRPRDSRLSRSFLFHYLLTEMFTQSAVGFQSRTGIPKINREQLGQVLIPIPPALEQQQISELLGVLDTKCDMLRREARLCDEVFRLMLDQFLNYQLAPPADFADEVLHE